MKNLILVSLLGLSFSAFAGPRFSAFTADGVLYVTVLGDCNSMFGNLEVEPTCKADRVTRNLSPVCNIDLAIGSTRMFCPPESLEAKVLSYKLSEQNIAPEAQVLNLKLGDQTISVEVNK